MNIQKEKVLLIFILILLNIVALTKIISATGEQTRESEKLRKSLEMAREYKKNDLNMVALDYYKESCKEEDTVEIRKEMIEAYDAALKNGELEEQTIIDDFVLGCVDQLWKESKMYDCALEYFKRKSDEEHMVSVIERAESNKISSNIIRAEYDTLSKKCTLLKLIFKDVKYSDSGTFCVSDGSKYGYIDAEGETLVEFMYDYATPFFDDYAVIKSDGYTYLGDTDGKRWKYLNNRILSSSGVGEGMIAANDGEKYYTYDINGKEKLKAYEYIGKFKQGIAAVKEGEHYLIIGVDGKSVSDEVFEEIKRNNLEECITNDVIFVKQEKKWHLINKEGKRLSEFTCDDLNIAYGSDLFAFKEGNKWGFADYTGKIVIHPQYDDARAFCNGYAGVKKKGKWGFIDSNNVYQMSGEYEDVMYFTDKGTCFVKRDGLWRMIKKVI